MTAEERAWYEHLRGCATCKRVAAKRADVGRCREGQALRDAHVAAGKAARDARPVAGH